MAVLFLDSSALVKRYVNEVGSGWVRVVSDPAARNECWVASVTRVEVVAALYGRVRARTLSPNVARRLEANFRAELGALFRSIPVGGAVLTNAMRLVGAHSLRTYDAVQLAVALSLQSKNATTGLVAPVFICADQDLTRAASLEGLRTDDPNLHP